MTRLSLTGDLMLGRGIDQILETPCDPQLYEDYAHSALDYVKLAERASGLIPRAVPLSYVWGDAAATLDHAGVDWCIINLETAITNGGVPMPKGINYRMSIQNAGGLQQLGIGCCVLANNHILDWGQQGLLDTIDTLHALGIPYAGVGRNRLEAEAPAILERAGRRVLVFGMACRDSGVARSWAATAETPGVNMLRGLAQGALGEVSSLVHAAKRPGDIVVASIHWGDNWGYEIPDGQINFAHNLIDQAGIDLVHGHSSHHPKGWELYKGRLILYGCGDFINDYEGIGGHEEYRSDLSAMYVVELDEVQQGQLRALSAVPFTIRKFSLKRAGFDDAEWLCALLNRESRNAGRRFKVSPAGILELAHA